MIIRIVRMHFVPVHTGAFLEIFNANHAAISKFPGCISVELLQDADDPSCYCTLSHWENAESLESYRQSELFGKVWRSVKILFSEKAEAFSLLK